MTPKTKDTTKTQKLKAMLEADRDLVRELLELGLQEILEAEMEQALAAGHLVNMTHPADVNPFILSCIARLQSATSPS